MCSTTYFLVLNIPKEQGIGSWTSFGCYNFFHVHIFFMLHRFSLMLFFWNFTFFHIFFDDEFFFHNCSFECYFYHFLHILHGTSERGIIWMSNCISYFQQLKWLDYGASNCNLFLLFQFFSEDPNMMHKYQIPSEFWCTGNKMRGSIKKSSSTTRDENTKET
jgi:hypothetical protein